MEIIDKATWEKLKALWIRRFVTTLDLVLLVIVVGLLFKCARVFLAKTGDHTYYLITLIVLGLWNLVVVYRAVFQVLLARAEINNIVADAARMVAQYYASGLTAPPELPRKK